MEATTARERIEALAEELRTGSDGVETYEVQAVVPVEGQLPAVVAPLLPADGRCAHCRCGQVRIDAVAGGFDVTITGERRLDGAQSVTLADTSAVLKFVREQGWSWCVEGADECADCATTRSLLEGVIATLEHRRQAIRIEFKQTPSTTARAAAYREVCDLLREIIG